MSSRYTDRPRHSRDDYDRHARPSYSDDRVKRRERDRDYDRRSENQRRSGKSAGKRCSTNEESRSLKSCKSRSKTDRTYNTDTEESDDSCGSSSKNTKRRLSSDCDEDVQDDRLHPERNDLKQEDSTATKATSKGSSSSSDSPRERSRSDTVGDRDKLKGIGPSLPRHLKKSSEENNSHKRQESQLSGPAVPSSSRRNCSDLSEDHPRINSDKIVNKTSDKNSEVDSSESKKPYAGPVLPAHLQGRTSLDESKDESQSIGPALPPHLRREASENDSEDEEDGKSVGPVLPPHRRKPSPSNHSDDEECKSVGPVLPSCLRKVSSDHSEDESLSIGPVLPPHLRRRTSSNISDEQDGKSIGPVLPPHLKVKRKSDDDGSSSDDESLPVEAPGTGSGQKPESPQDPGVFGPALPPRMASSSRVLGPAAPPGTKLSSEIGEKSSDDSDDEIIGPMLPEQLIQSNRNLLVHAQLERRAAEVKREMEKKDDGVDLTKRELWMLELPPEGTVDLGLGARTFRMKGAPEKGADRSGWTDTPEDKLRKQEQAARDALNEGSGGSSSFTAVGPPDLSVRDSAMEKIVKKHSKKRGKESLLDMHQKELHKKKKKEKNDGKKEERRPFSREIDLKTNVFDEAQKKSIFKKAQLLDSRFSRGDTKYL